MTQQRWNAPARLGPCLHLRGWLARYVWPTYCQRRFIEAARRDMRRLAEGQPELGSGTGRPGS